MNLHALGFLDTSSLSAAYVSRGRKQVEIDEEFRKDCRPAANLLNRITSGAAAYFGGRPPLIVGASFRRYHPEDAAPWKMLRKDTALLTVCLIPSPGLWHYAGGEAAVLPVGQLTHIAPGVLWSTVNFGPVTGVHLTIELKARTDDGGQDRDGEPDPPT